VNDRDGTVVKKNLQIHRTSPPVIPAHRFTPTVTIRSLREVDNRGGGGEGKRSGGGGFGRGQELIGCA
jgi:hypothetical protein